MVTTKGRLTLGDLAHVPDDGERYDILGGELVVRNAPDMNHGRLLTELTGLLYAAQQAGYGEVYTSTTAVALDYPARGQRAEDVVHPDLVFVRRERLTLIGERCIEGVPDLIVEILSRTTRGQHQPGGSHRDAYARHGVPHYWLVDPQARTVEPFALAGEPYRAGSYGAPTVLHGGDVLASSLFPTLTLPLAQLFARVRGGTGR